jgi:hypothetical protein
MAQLRILKICHTLTEPYFITKVASTLTQLQVLLFSEGHTSVGELMDAREISRSFILVKKEKS